MRISNLLLLALLAIWPAAGRAGTGEILQGWVVAVQDGDSVSLLVSGNRQIRVRLAQIDAPEYDQAFGQQSRQSLIDLALNKKALLSVETMDKDGRTVGTLYADGVDISREQIKRGMAWAYRQYLHDDTLLDIERQARRGRVGLWSDAKPMSPWRYRHGGRNKSELSESSAAGEKTTPPVHTSCGQKRYCREMTSCEEAKFYLNHCGLPRLDADHDGLPCESLCGHRD